MHLEKLEPVLTPRALYFGDNGRCFCGKHAGASAVDVEAFRRGELGVG